MDCKGCAVREKEAVPYIVWESAQARHERSEKRHWIAHIVSIIAIVLVVVGFLVYLNQYDFEAYTYEYEQDGQGINIIGDRNGGIENNVTTPYSTPED